MVDERTALACESPSRGVRERENCAERQLLSLWEVDLRPFCGPNLHHRGLYCRQLSPGEGISIVFNYIFTILQLFTYFYFLCVIFLISLA